MRYTSIKLAIWSPAKPIMDSTLPHTGYARLTPLAARTVLVLLLLVALVFVGVTLSPLAHGYADKDRPGEGDIALYRAKLERINAGQDYYEAAGAEMRVRGYPTRSVFNWRIPLHFWLIGWMPKVQFGKALLGALALALMLVAFEALAREDVNRIGRPVACILLLTGPLIPCILGNLFVMPVLWAGVLIALSICAYGLRRPGWGVGFGLLAIFIRELAMPYCLVAVGLAWWHKRRGELAAWTVGLVVWAVYFGLHWLQVTDLIMPGDRAHRESWVQFGGAAQVISNAQMNAYLLLLPQWVTGLYFVAAMFGFAGWHTPLGLRAGLTACLFVAAFGIAGQELHQYWGSLIAPLLCFGVVRFPASLCDLWRAAAWQPVLVNSQT